MNLSSAQSLFRLAGSEHGGAKQAHEYHREVKSAVEQMLHLPEISMPILREVKRVVRARGGRLQIAQHRVDRLELRQLDTLNASASYRSFVLNAQRLYGFETPEPIGHDRLCCTKPVR